MKAFTKFLATLALLLSFNSIADAGETKTFVVVTSAETEVQGMAMVLSMQALKNGSDVRVLLCGSGGDIALKSKESIALKPINKSPRQMMMALISKGVTVEVCALYMPNRGLNVADLVDGVKGVMPPVIGTYMADPNVRYFSF